MVRHNGASLSSHSLETEEDWEYYVVICASVSFMRWALWTVEETLCVMYQHQIKCILGLVWKEGLVLLQEPQKLWWCVVWVWACLLPQQVPACHQCWSWGSSLSRSLKFQALVFAVCEACHLGIFLGTSVSFLSLVNVSSQWNKTEKIMQFQFCSH